MFVGKDVAEILEYQNGSRDINRHIDEEDRHKVMLFDGNQNKETIIINESGLYSLILSSKMPNAKKFKHWVTADVLPAIRKTGMYATDELLDNPDLAIQAFTALKLEREKNKKLNTTVKVQEQQIMELQPKASYYDLVLNCPDLLSVTVIAKDYGKSAKWFRYAFPFPHAARRFFRNKDWRFQEHGTSPRLLHCSCTNHNCRYIRIRQMPMLCVLLPPGLQEQM